MSKVFHLIDRAILKLTGSDKETFLQGLITNDIGKVNENPIYAMMLTPQGRFLYDFFVIKNADSLFLDVLHINKDEIIKKLNMYKLRADIKIEDLSDQFKVCASFSKFDENDFNDPRHDNFSFRLITDKLLPYVSDNNEYEEKRINLKIPDAYKDFIPEKSFPLEYGAINLNAIDFEKGCYIGQEVTARTYHRGVIRKKLYLLKCENEQPPLKGDEIFANSIKIGISLGFHEDKGLGLLNIEEAEKNFNNELHTHNSKLYIEN